MSSRGRSFSGTVLFLCYNLGDEEDEADGRDDENVDFPGGHRDAGAVRGNGHLRQAEDEGHCAPSPDPGRVYRVFVRNAVRPGVDRMRKFGRATKAASAVAMALVLLAAGGCLYPRDRTPDGGMAPREAALAVQEAVNRYFETHGTLPLFNADANVPKYEKFRVDFARLKSAGFLPAPPPAAFEGGGPYLFLIVDEERDPK